MRPKTAEQRRPIGQHPIGVDRRKPEHRPVVVATPLGTAGYSRAAGGPRLAPDTGLAVVPIAPFAMTADQWVVRPPLGLRVERDDDVSVFADGNRVTSGGGGLTVSVTVAGAVTVVDCRRLAERGRNWKNSNESSPHD